MALAFEQQRKESDKAFAAFSVYLSQGPQRSLAKTAAKLSRSKVLMEKWSRRWADLVMVTYALVANLPCILAQRYNRLRFQRVLARRSWPASN